MKWPISLLLVVVAATLTGPRGPARDRESENASSGPPALAEAETKECAFDSIALKGRVQIVDAFPDIEVQLVDAFPDIRVKWVTAFPDNCGEWQEVDAFPDFTIRIVDAFPDLTVQVVESFPGMGG